MNRYLKNISIDHWTIVEIQQALEKGMLTSRELVMYYLQRIAQYDQEGPKINSMLEINPDAIFLAEALDYERKTKGTRGLLHGIPIVLKDNIETRDHMHTSAGTIALENNIARQDAFLVTKLRQAGAILLGKTNMTELANGMSSSMWAGYSGRGGQVLNPYGPGEFFVGGSSTGSAVAVAANFATISVGTETDASILSPAVQNSVVGLKPTVGLISRTGMIPFTYSQDTAGPIARNVTDATILLGALTGVDPSDSATYKSEGNSHLGFMSFLDQDGLRGARIGIFRSATNGHFMPGEFDEVLYEKAVQAIKNAGAETIEQVKIPSFDRDWSWKVNEYELKASLGEYLANLPCQAPVHSINELIKFNQEYENETLKYGQDKLETRETLSSGLRTADYLQAKLDDLYFSQDEGIDYVLKKYQLDVILFPGYVGSTLSAKAGYPSIAVPAGYMKNGRPFGITFAGTAFSEGMLIKYAYSFEQITKHRKAPEW